MTFTGRLWPHPCNPATQPWVSPLVHAHTLSLHGGCSGHLLFPAQLAPHSKASTWWCTLSPLPRKPPSPWGGDGSSSLKIQLRCPWSLKASRHPRQPCSPQCSQVPWSLSWWVASPVLQWPGGLTSHHSELRAQRRLRSCEYVLDQCWSLPS